MPVSLSVVSSLYRSSGTVVEFVRRSAAAAAQITPSFEIVLVNDGSPDDSLDKALALLAEFPQLRIVDLSRNFGHHFALMTGLEQSRGELVFLIDSDLEEAPELLLPLWKELDEATDSICGVQEQRKGARIERASGIFYKLFNLLSPLPIPENHLTARVMRRPYVDALVSFKERELFLGGIMAAAGFRQKQIPLPKVSRGTTTYTLGHRAAVFINAVTSFSSLPLFYLCVAGLVISLASWAFALWRVLSWLLLGTSVVGWTSLIVSIWMVGGMLLFAIGVVGIYIAKVFTEVKRRPYTIIRRVYEAP